MTYRRRKVDTNQGEIVRALYALGCGVVDLSAVGSGCPDLLVGFRGKNYLLEVKRPGEKIRADGRGEKQREFHAWWDGPIAIVTSVAEAVAVVQSCASRIRRPY